MRPELPAAFTPAVIASIVARFGAKRFTLLSDWHALTLMAARDGHPIVPRLSHSARRSPEQIRGEIDWIHELRSEGFAVPTPQLSITRRTTETIEFENAIITGVAFSELRGQEITASDWNKSTFERWGALIGRMHCSTRERLPKHSRDLWHDSDFLNIERYIPKDELAALRPHPFGPIRTT